MLALAGGAMPGPHVRAGPAVVLAALQSGLGLLPRQVQRAERAAVPGAAVLEPRLERGRRARGPPRPARPARGSRPGRCAPRRAHRLLRSEVAMCRKDEHLIFDKHLIVV